MKTTSQQLNTDARQQLYLAYEMGFPLPGDIIQLYQMPPHQVRQLSDDTNILILDQDTAIVRPDGIEMSYSMFYNGEKMSLYTAIINDRYLLAGRQGPEMDINCLTLFCDKPAPIMPHVKKMIGILSQWIENFTGFITLDVTLAPDGPWFRRAHVKTVRPEYLETMARMVDLTVDELVAQIEVGEDIQRPTGYGTCLQLYSYPYQVEDNFTLIPDLVGAGVRCKEGYNGPVVVSYADTIKSAWKSLYKQIPSINGVCFRADGDRYARQIFNKLKKEGYH